MRHRSTLPVSAVASILPWTVRGRIGGYLLLAAWGLMPIAHGQTADEAPPTVSLTIAEIEARANAAVSAGRYQDAIPDLQEVIRKAEAVSDPELQKQIAEKVQRLKFILAFCYVVDRQYDQAIDALTAFANDYPNSSRTRQALTLKAFAEKSASRWTEAADTLQRILQDARMPYAEKLELGLSLGECLLNAGSYRPAYNQLRDVVLYAEDPVVRMSGISGMLEAILKLGDPLALYELVPALQGQVSPVRYSLTFNLKAIDAGDQLVESGQLLPAFVLYKLCQDREAIRAGLNLVRERLLWQQERLKRQTDAILSNFQQLVAVDARLQIVQAEQKALEEADTYDEGLRYRIARVLSEMDLTAEAYWAFRDIVADYPGSPNAPEALFASGSLAAQLGLRDRAMGTFKIVIDRFPESPRAAEAVFSLAYMYQERNDIEAMITLLSQALDSGLVTRTGEDLGHALYLMGYAQLYLGNLDEAARWFERLHAEAPDNTYRKDADYWTAYLALMTDHFEEAEQQFRTFIETYRQGRYIEDARFRVVLARFGTGDMSGALELAQAFLREYPTSGLRGEAHNALGDLYGALGQLDEAINNYLLVEEFTDQPDQVHAAVFNAARVMEVDGRWEDIVHHFQKYIDRYGDQGKYTMAVYHMGTALKHLGKTREVSELYWKTFLRDANDPSKLGVDVMLRDAIAEAPPESDFNPVALLTRELEQTGDDEVTKRLRLLWGLSLAGEDNRTPARFTEAEIAQASPALIDWMAPRLVANHELDLAVFAYKHLIEDFPETDWTPGAMVALGELEQQRGHIEEARARFQTAYDLYPTWTAGGVAAVRLADLAYDAGQFEAAAERYEEVLLVREWRGPLWAEALYKLGRCREAAGNLEEAFAYYQRVYVLYAHHLTWAAKAYLASAHCLEALNRPAEARATYEEMLGVAALQDLPEIQTARERIAALPPPPMEPDAP